MATELEIFMHLVISLLTFVILVMLSNKYLKDKNVKYRTHELTLLLLILVFFLFIDSFVLSLAEISETYFLSNFPVKQGQLISKIGLLVSTIFLSYFLLDNRIEELKKNEVSLHQFEKLNHELEVKIKEMEDSQVHQEKKIGELERFNDIAKERESKMMDLVQKIKKLESKVRKK